MEGRKNAQRTNLLFRKVKLRTDVAPWWGLTEWDEKWACDLESFQLPKPIIDLGSLGGGAFKKKTVVKPWAVEGHEETSAYSWGWGGEGRLGQGVGRDDKRTPTLVNRSVGVRVGGVGRFVDVACGRQHTLAVTEDGVLYAWGDGHSGQLGSRKLERFCKESSDDDSEESLLSTDEDDEADPEGMAAKKRRDARPSMDRYQMPVEKQHMKQDAEEREERKRARRKRRRRRKRKHEALGLASAMTGRGFGGGGNGAKDWSANLSNPHRPVAKGLQEIMNTAKRVMLRRPTAVLPSGYLKRGADVVAQEVAAGNTTSFAREATAAEGEAGVLGLEEMTQAVNLLHEQYPESEGLLQLRTYLYEEHRMVERQYTGAILSWGSGARGELGLGAAITRRTRPTSIPFFAANRICIEGLSAGKRHVIAASNLGYLYSWGCGAGGRLGHNDYRDRWEPCRIEALSHAVVKVFACGDAHSLASISQLRPDHQQETMEHNQSENEGKTRTRPSNKKNTSLISTAPSHIEDRVPSSSDGSGVCDVGPATMEAGTKIRRKVRKLTLHEQQCKTFPVGVYTWGRGAHGRLGHGRNDNQRKPTRIKAWPDSFEGYCVVGAALGGAHTIVLAERRTHPGLVNPWGRHRLCYAFGYGFNGQLGTDNFVDEFVPVPVKFPRWELVAQVAAGKAHSLALTVFGEVYAWGKNMYGELGTGNYDVTAAPIKIAEKDGALFLRLCAGDRHSIGLGLRQRPPHLTRKHIERQALNPKSIGSVYLGMRRVEASILSSYECARRAPLKANERAYAQGAPRLLQAGDMYECVTCNLSAICRSCVQWCHVKKHHHVCGRKVEGGNDSGDADKKSGGRSSRRLCECSLGPSCELLLCVCEESPNQDQSAAVVLQRPVRAWLARRELFALRLARWRMRRAVSIRVWGDKVVNPVWAAVERHADSKKQENERLSMEVADIESRASRQYMKLQIVLQAMETQKMAVGALVAMTGVLDPHPTVRELWHDPLGFYTEGIPDCILRMRRKAKAQLGSPFHRHRSHQSLRQAQRQYPLMQRLRVGSAEEKELCQDVSWRLQIRACIWSEYCFSFLCWPHVAHRAREYKSQWDQIPLYGSHESFMRVPDIDTSEFIRLAEGGPNNRRRTSIAAPSCMYQRVATLRHQMLRKQTILRRRSFSIVARVDKASSKEDNRLAETFSKEQMDGVRLSLSLARKVMLPKALLDNHLAISGVMPKSKAGQTLGMSKFALMLVPYEPLQPDLEVGSILLRFVDRRMEKVLRAHDPIMTIAAQLDQVVASSKLHATAAGHEVGPSKRQSSGQRSSIVSPGSSNHESNRALSLGGGVVPMSPLALGGGGAGHGRLEGMTAAEKLRVEREEERARRHLSRHKRRHSIAAPERTPSLVELWRRHHKLVGSLRLNPLQGGEYSFGGFPSGARDADFNEQVRRRLRHGDDGPFEMHRMDRSDWGEESKMIELSAEQAGFSLEDPAVRIAAEQQRAAERESKRLRKQKEKQDWEQQKEEAKKDDAQNNDANSGGGDAPAITDGDSTGRTMSMDETGGSTTVHSRANEWYEACGHDGTAYFYNASGEALWELPAGAVVVADPSVLTMVDEYGGDEEWADWEEHWDADGNVYWYHPKSDESYYDE